MTFSDADLRSVYGFFTAVGFAVVGFAAGDFAGDTLVLVATRLLGKGYLAGALIAGLFIL